MSAAPHVWIVDDDASIRWVLERAVRDAGMVVHLFDSAAAVLKKLQTETPNVLLTDVRMPGGDGLELLRQIRKLKPKLPVIIMTAFSDFESTMTAFKDGAFEYLTKPFDLDHALALVRRASGNASTVGTAIKPMTQSAQLQGRAPAMQQVFRAIARLARSNVTVLLRGESGTGKERVARTLHQHSARAAEPFIAMDTSAIPGELLESELFGHEKGAFTGAALLRRGRFEQADGGTLFLDEIGDMPLSLQTRLLRVLAEGEFYRVGGQESLRVNVRVIAATHRDLAQRVREGQFREDLYHRLNVVSIELPPLRERREDIPELLLHYLQQAANELQLEPKKMHPQALAALVNYRWPGNIRELVNLCRRLTALAPGQEIQRQDLPDELDSGRRENDTSHWTTALTAWIQTELGQERLDSIKASQVEFDKILFQAVMQHTRGHRQAAAKLLGLSRNTLTRKLRDLGLD
jgi:two-component system, NtrC family, nitrogen regulation response regulator GlnG